MTARHDVVFVERAGKEVAVVVSAERFGAPLWIGEHRLAGKLKGTAPVVRLVP